MEGVLAAVGGSGDMKAAVSALPGVPARVGLHIAASLSRLLRAHVAPEGHSGTLCRIVAAMKALLGSPHLSPRCESLLLVGVYAVLVAEEGDIKSHDVWLSRRLAAEAFVVPLKRGVRPGAPHCSIDVVDPGVLQGDGVLPQYALLCLALHWGVPAISRLLAGNALQLFCERRLGKGDCADVFLREAVFEVALLLRRTPEASLRGAAVELLAHHGPSLLDDCAPMAVRSGTPPPLPFKHEKPALRRFKFVLTSDTK